MKANILHRRAIETFFSRFQQTQGKSILYVTQFGQLSNNIKKKQFSDDIIIKFLFRIKSQTSVWITKFFLRQDENTRYLVSLNLDQPLVRYKTYLLNTLFE